MAFMAIAGKVASSVGKAASGAVQKGVQGARKVGSGIKSGVGAVKNAKKVVDEAAELAKQKLKKFLLIKIGIPAGIILVALGSVSIILDSIFKTSGTSIKYASGEVSRNITGDRQQIERALELQEKYGSTIGFTLNQISQMVDIGMGHLDSSSDIYAAYNSKYGTITEFDRGMPQKSYEDYNKFGKLEGEDLSDLNATEENFLNWWRYTNEGEMNNLITSYDREKLYEHILKTEKYNFNAINWIAYNHDGNSEKIEKKDLKLDNELGLLYPDKGDTTLDDFIDMASPYLLSSQVPLAFTSSSVYSSNYSGSIGNNNYQAFADNASGKTNNIGDFAYQIIRHGLSDIQIGQFNLESYTENTFWREYTRYEAYDTATVKIRVREGYNVQPYGQPAYEADYTTSLGAVQLSVENYTDGSSSGTAKEQVNTRTTDHKPLDTTENHTNEIDPMKETRIGEPIINTTTKYKLTSALAFDVRVSNVYNYIKYSDDNRNKRKGENYNSGITSEEFKIIESTSESESDMIYTTKINGGKSSHVTRADLISCRDYDDLERLGFENIQPTSITGTRVQGSDGSYYIEYTFNIKTKPYYYEEGVQNSISRTWSDTLDEEPKDSTKTMLSANDIASYNRNPNNDLSMSTIDTREFKSSTDSMNYYNDIVKTEGIGLNIVDFVNSNPKIINNYLMNTQKYARYVGKPRTEYSMTNGRSMLYKEFETLMDNNNNIMPFVYGASLGFDVGAKPAKETAPYITALMLIRDTLRSYNDLPVMLNSRKKKAATEEDCKYYKVVNKDGRLFVGYNLYIDMLTGDERNEFLELIDKDDIVEGDIIEKEIVDKYEEQVIKDYIKTIKNSTSAIELKEYQVHSLVSRFYSIGSSYLSAQTEGGLDFLNSYNTYWNEEEDDKYEELIEINKETPLVSSSVLNNVDYNNKLYLNYMKFPDIDSLGNSTSTRRQDEFAMFSVGYYTPLEMFYKKSSLGPGDIDLYNSDGSVNEEACLELQNWFHENIFDGSDVIALPETLNAYQGLVWTGNDNLHNKTVVHELFKAPSGGAYSEHLGLQLFQCTWWAESRASLYLVDNAPDKFPNGISGYTGWVTRNTGNGVDVAKNIADNTGAPFNTEVDEIRENSVISWHSHSDEFGDCGHVGYVEAVDYTQYNKESRTGNIYFYISEAGGGHSWYGINKRDKDSVANNFDGSVSMDDVIEAVQ